MNSKRIKRENRRLIAFHVKKAGILQLTPAELQVVNLENLSSCTITYSYY